MTRTHPLRISALAAWACLTAVPALAQDSGYYYGGLSVGQARARVDEPRITAGLLGAGLATTSINSDNRAAGFKLFGGYQLHPNFAVEAGYFNLGQFGFTSTTMPAGTLDGRMRVQGLNLDLVGLLPLTDRWAATARVGVHHAHTRDRFRGTGAVGVFNPRPSTRDTNFKLGVGLQYALSQSMLVRLDAERYRVNDAVGNKGDVNLVSLSLVFPFGRDSAPPARVAAAPVYVAPLAPVVVVPPAAPPPVVATPPTPAPVVVAAPERRRVRFEADALFAFDKSEIQPQGRAALDAFAREVQGSAYDVVIVEGHTDRIGSETYNPALSLRRAEAVRKYLITSAALDTARVSATGLGETRSVTSAGDCVGQRATPSLIACLQPDRRVEVEVTGTR